MQIGWATEQCTYKCNEGVGIGDDTFSFAYDGCRSLLWHNQQNEKHAHRRWKSGDVLGLYLDLTNATINFSLNGVLLPEWRGLPGTVRVFGRNLHSRMPLDPTRVRLKLLHAFDQ
jgi:hypothetical protein